MKIVTKLSERDIIRFNFYIFYRNWVVRIITGLMILGILSSVLFSEIAKSRAPNSLFGPFLFLVVFPLMVYIRAKRNYKSNRRINEQIEYVFDNQNLIITGESFNITMTWDKIIKVIITKKWILIWQTKYSANIIPLKDIQESDFLNLKDILNSRGVNNNL